MMTAKTRLACATSSLAIILFTPAALADTLPEDSGPAPIVALSSPIDMNVATWAIDRTPTAGFDNVVFEGRDTIRVRIEPPSSGQSFSDWQGYNHDLKPTSGAGVLQGDLWIGDEWREGGSEDYVRTGIWGSLLPEGGSAQDVAQAIYPIISFTNQNGEGRLEVWENDHWVDLGGNSSSVLNFDSWNRFETRVLPDSDKIDYLVNGQVIYTWEMPRGAQDDQATQFWQIYLNPRNNGVTAFDTYWSNLKTAELLFDGDVVTDAANGIEVLANGVGTVSVAPGVQANGVTTGANSQATLAFNEQSGVQTSGDGAHGVISSEGSPLSLEGGTVTTSGAGAHGLYATGEGSAIHATGTDVAVTGPGSYGAAVTEGGSVELVGGSVTSSSRALSAVGGTIKTTDTAITSDVGPQNGSDTGAVYATAGGEITLSGGRVDALGDRNSALLAVDNGRIDATNVEITASGDRARGAYAGADSGGAGAITLTGGSISTNGVLSHGLFAKRESGSIGDMVATIDANDVAITVDGDDANGVYADVGSAITVTGGSVTTHGLRGVGLHAQSVDDEVTGLGTLVATNVAVETTGELGLGAFVEQGGELTINGGSITTSGQRASGVVAVSDGSKITLNGASIATSGNASYGVGASDGGSITGSVDVSTSGDGAAGVMVGGDSLITLNDSSVKTLGSQAHGLMAGQDMDYGQGGVLDATNIDVTTRGDNAVGALAQDGGQIKLSGGTVTTEGAQSHGLVTVGAPIYTRSIPVGNSRVEATDVAIRTSGEGAAGAVIVGQGEIRLSGGSIDASGPALLAQTVDSTVSAFNVSGTTLGSSSGQLLVVDRSNDPQGTGTVSLSLSEGAQATGDIVDLSPRSYGSTSVTVDASTLTGAIRGVQNLTLSSGATWNATGAEGIGIMSIGMGGATIATTTDVLLDTSLYGTEGLTKAGDGRLIFAGDGSDYLGSVQVDAGTLALTGSLGGDAVIGADGTFDIGGGGTTGKFAGNVVNDGTLLISRTDDIRFDGLLSGAGSVVKTGGGELLFTGDGAAFSGVTTVSEGSLALEGALGGNASVKAGALLSIGNSEVNAGFSGNIANDGDVVFAQADNFTYVGNLSGGGTLSKMGNNVLTLTGDNAAFTGTTHVNQGAVTLLGTLGGSVVVDQGRLFTIGNQDVAGHFSGEMLVNGSLILAGNVAGVQSGTLSGSGSVVKNGAGDLTFAVDGSAYTGSTVIAQGKMILTGSLGGRAMIDADAALVLQGGALNANLINKGQLAIGGAEDTRYDGTLTGTGTILKDGSGTFHLTGRAGLFAGNTAVTGGTLLLTGALGGTVLIDTAGTLQVGDGITNGDLTAATINNGKMIFDQVGDYDYTGALAGNGGLVKRGSGVLLLSGDYQYTGSTVVEGGLVKLTSQLDKQTDLVIDNGTFDLSDKQQEIAGLSGNSGTLALGETGELTVTQTQNSIFAGSIEGNGIFTKAGDGTLNLTGASSFTGDVGVIAGTLKINGTLPALVIVHSGAELGGNGQIADMKVTQGGNVAPGNSIGTLHVDGNVTFDAGSIYTVEVDAAGNSDKIIASGSAQINGGTVSVLAAAGNYRWTSDYVILTANGGVNGRFAASDVSLPFLDPVLNYGANNVTLTLVRNDRTFDSVATTRNQRAVALALEAGSHDTGLYRALSAQTDDTSATRAFDALSGELWGTTNTLLVDQSRRIGDLTLGRLQQADTVSHALSTATSGSTQTGDGIAIWGQAIGGWNTLQGDGNAARTTQHEFGFITGLDTAFGDWRIGAAFNHAQGKVDLAVRGDRATVTSSSAVVYAGGGWGNLRFRAGASYGWHKMDGARAVSFTGYSDDLSGIRHGETASLFGETSFAASLGKALVEPFAGLSYVHLRSKGASETGGSAALVIDETVRDVTFSTLGLRLGAVLPLSAETALTPHLSAAWLHSFGDRAGLGDYALSSNGQGFTSAGLPVARNSAAIEAGAQVNILPGGSLGLNYVGNIGDRWTDHGLKLGFSYSF